MTPRQAIQSKKPRLNYLVTMAQISKSQYDQKGTKDIAYCARKHLIYLGKVLPFLICAIVTISYLECLFALLTYDYIQVGEDVYLNKPISFFIGEVFELDFPTWLFLAITTIAIKTCKWNKLAVLYLAFQLFEKSYFATHCWDIEYYYIVIEINAIVSCFLVLKGLIINS